MIQQPLLPYQNPLSARLGLSFFKLAPQSPGVYLMYGLGGQIIYVGKAKNLRARLASYRRAKPHQVSRKTVRLIHSIDEIRYELCATESQALLRENELLRLHRPFFNVVNTEPESYFFIGVRAPRTRRITALEFILTTDLDRHAPEWPKEAFFGAFKGRGKVREGFQTMLRLLWATQAEGARFAYPGCLIRHRAPEYYAWQLPAEMPEQEARKWLSQIQCFLRGTSDGLLGRLTQELLSNMSIPPFYYRAIQEDLERLREFYRFAPARNRGIRAVLGLKTALIAQDALDDLIVLSNAKRGKTP